MLSFENSNVSFGLKTIIENYFTKDERIRESLDINAVLLVKNGFVMNLFM